MYSVKRSVCPRSNGLAVEAAARIREGLIEPCIAAGGDFGCHLAAVGAGFADAFIEGSEGGAGILDALGPLRVLAEGWGYGMSLPEEVLCGLKGLAGCAVVLGCSGSGRGESEGVRVRLRATGSRAAEAQQEATSRGRGQVRWDVWSGKVLRLSCRSGPCCEIYTFVSLGGAGSFWSTSRGRAAGGEPWRRAPTQRPVAPHRSSGRTTPRWIARLGGSGLTSAKGWLCGSGLIT
jgi:hypothetical protein